MKCDSCGLLFVNLRIIKYDDGGSDLIKTYYCSGDKFCGYLLEDIPDYDDCPDFIEKVYLSKYCEER